MYAGWLALSATATRNSSATFGSGMAPLSGRWMYLMPVVLTAASSSATPCSVGSLKLMIEANPCFFRFATPVASVAPPHANTASIWLKFVTPATSTFLTWAKTGAASIATARAAARRLAVMEYLPSAEYYFGWWLVVSG